MYDIAAEGTAAVAYASKSPAKFALGGGKSLPIAIGFLSLHEEAQFAFGGWVSLASSIDIKWFVLRVWTSRGSRFCE